MKQNSTIQGTTIILSYLSLLHPLEQISESFYMFKFKICIN